MATAKASIPTLPPPLENSLFKNLQALRAAVNLNPGLPAEACLCGLNLLGDNIEKLPQVVV